MQIKDHTFVDLESHIIFDLTEWREATNSSGQLPKYWMLVTGGEWRSRA